jgi:prepilin-type N-terminal cleavage/methylation domain-containing protein
MNLRNGNTRKGFTLIELLVVVAIVAILSIVVLLTLNPAELLRQARDSNRISDLATVRAAVSLYLADVSSPVIGTSTWCTTSVAQATTTANACNASLGFSAATTNYASTTAAGSGVFAVNGTGWVPVNFNQISSGAPFGSLPRDPINAADSVSCCRRYYGYTSSSTSLTFKLVAKMESAKYASSGASDVESTDGGISNNTYEVGTNLSL